MQLRWYQDEARQSLWDGFKRDIPNQLIVLPTGSGKTPVIATVARDAIEQYKGRVLILSHVRELLDQAEGTIKKWSPSLDTGVYSAGLRRRELDNDCLIAGIQSIYKKAHEVGRRHLVLIDEAHLISPNDGTMYRSFLDDLAAVNPNLKIAGLTATPYRTTSGRIYGREELFDRVAFEAPIGRLIEEGYLSPIVNKPAGVTVDTSTAGIRNKEFVTGDLEQLLNRDAVVRPACQEVLGYTQGRQSILVFAVSVAHGEKITETLNDLGEPAEFIDGETPSLIRAERIDRFKRGELRTLVNCQVLTTGFDATRVDCVVVMRPTCSPGLFYQMAGRGLRLHEGKADCLLLDYGGNIQRHGSLDDPSYGESSFSSDGGGEAPKKKCPGCGEESPLSTRECWCGWIFPQSTMPRHDETADTESEVLGSVQSPEWYTVERIEWNEHIKKGSDSRTLRVDYFYEGMRLRDRPFSEWICIEHDGWVRSKAEAWWAQRSLAPCPETIDDAIQCYACGMIADTQRIQVGSDPKNPKYNRIFGYEIGELPEESEWMEPVDDFGEEIPF